MKVLSVVGARPNFMKVGPVDRALRAAGAESVVVHTGQHYDARMSDVFFRQLGLPEPHHTLGVGGGTHAQQTGRVMEAIEPVMRAEAPDVVVVVGDVNSTLAAALVATKLHLPTAHVEAGLRSGDRRMPEELNRLATDAVADLLLVSEPSGLGHLAREGADPDRVVFVGNTMIDTLVALRARAEALGTARALGLDRGEYVLLTLHRPANVDAEAPLREVARLLRAVAAVRPAVLPLHPRTRGNLERVGLLGDVLATPGLTVTEPAGYLEFLDLMAGAAAVVTDSGGIQEETTVLGVRCLTVRDSTERPVTVTEGTNELVPLDADTVARRLRARLAEPAGGRIPELWDGRAAERIVAVLLERYG